MRALVSLSVPLPSPPHVSNCKVKINVVVTCDRQEAHEISATRRKHAQDHYTAKVYTA